MREACPAESLNTRNGSGFGGHLIQLSPCRDGKAESQRAKVTPPKVSHHISDIAQINCQIFAPYRQALHPAVVLEAGMASRKFLPWSVAKDNLRPRGRDELMLGYEVTEDSGLMDCGN